MVRHVSTGTIIEQLSALIDTDDLSDWEAGFITNLVDISNRGQVTRLSDKQIERLKARDYKHFA